MANTYSPLLRLIRQTIGDNKWTWGNYENTNVTELLEQAIAGVTTVTVTGSTGYTLTSGNGIVDEARSAVIVVTGLLTQQVNIVCPSSPKIYYVRNNTSGGYGINFKTASGLGVVITNGSSNMVFCDGTNIVQGISASAILAAIDGVPIGQVTPALLTGTTVSATTQFSGAGTGLTGTAASLSIGGNAATATTATTATNATNSTNATTAVNLASGSAGTLPYQSASGTTAMLAAGSSGNVLLSGGAGAPSWSATTGAGSVAKADSPTFTGTGNTATWNMTTPQYGGIAMGRMVQGTAVATTSGTAIDFTGVPSWVKRITVMLNGVSTNGSSIVQLQMGSGSVETTGYAGAIAQDSGAGYYTNSFATGFPMASSSAASSANTLTGRIEFSIISGNIWVASGAISSSSYLVGIAAGSKSLSGVLDRIRLTTVNGTDTFDAGSVNILYEG